MAATLWRLARIASRHHHKPRVILGASSRSTARRGIALIALRHLPRQKCANGFKLGRLGDARSRRFAPGLFGFVSASGGSRARWHWVASVTRSRVARHSRPSCYDSLPGDSWLLSGRRPFAQTCRQKVLPGAQRHRGRQQGERAPNAKFLRLGKLLTRKGTRRRSLTVTEQGGMDRAVQPEAGWRVQVINDRTGHKASASTRRLALSNE
jgi:hypothetical protein